MFKKYVQDKIQSLTAQKNSIVVLKGIPLKIVGAAENIAAAAESPLQYFFANAERKFWSYEEFLLLNEFMRAQFNEIFILSNNLYIAQFPIEEKFGAGTLADLLEHFTEPDSERYENLNLGKLGALFTGLKRHKNILIGVYNDETALENFDLEPVDLFPPPRDIPLNSGSSQEFFELNDESDFVWLMQKIIFHAPLEIYISLENYSGDRSELETRLKILHENFSEQTKIYILPAAPAESPAPFKSSTANVDFLKKFWGYDSFRSFTVYDLQNLNAAAGIKPTLEVSQEQIISDIIAQIELCRAGERYRDIFVTASTGAGKSLIFQFPAIWFAEKFRLFTIVISPLIGLMDDQVKNLRKIYAPVETFNSGTPPLVKKNITQKISAGEVNILYISPETLLARSELEQLIGARTVGLIVIDEAHIVTTWGKQFRPDYWYLGDHIRRLQKNQRERRGHSFVIATFTATMIFQGFENMYEETVDSLNMRNPIRYFGEIKRGDIEIEIDRAPITGGKTAIHDILKFDDLTAAVDRANIFERKTLIYFPEVRLVEKALMALQNIGKAGGVAIYHGQLDNEVRRASQLDFARGKKFVMLATKAFGMGIDISDIEIVMHYAPTGNVCDYVQEIGRAARDKNLRGIASYHYSPRDFNYINRLHGMSKINLFQLFKVIEKLCALYRKNANGKNSLLLDAKNFTYIFDRYGDENSSVNKVKTALLIIQRDFERKFGFSPIHVRPIPLFAYGYFEISPRTQTRLKNKFGDCLDAAGAKNICRVNLKRIWERGYGDFTFPQFKYLLYTGSKNLPFNGVYDLRPALRVSINFKPSCEKIYSGKIAVFKNLAADSNASAKYVTAEDLAAEFVKQRKIADYTAQNISEVLTASVLTYAENFYKGYSALFAKNFRTGGKVSYRFAASMNRYFVWLDKIFSDIVKETAGGTLYLKNSQGSDARTKTIVLGILEALGVLSFEMTGGEDTQLYIHITQISNLQNILRHRDRYRNYILEDISARHKISVAMLTYLYENNFTSGEIWDLLEDYFFGEIPAGVDA